MKFKKWIPFLLTLTMAFGTLPVGVYAEDVVNVTPEISVTKTS